MESNRKEQSIKIINVNSQEELNLDLVTVQPKIFSIGNCYLTVENICIELFYRDIISNNFLININFLNLRLI